MKDANLIAIQELQGILNIIEAYKRLPEHDDLYVNGFNDALHMLEVYVSRRSKTLEKEIQL